MVKFYKTPFAESGTKTAVPNDEQIDGSVSYHSGFGLDYQRVYPTDPLAKPFPRPQNNDILFDITENIQQYQTHGVPEFITTADNDGDPYPYEKYAIVRYDDGDGFKNYVSMIDDNETEPTDLSSWAIIDPTCFAIPQAFFEATVVDGDLVYFNSGTSEYTKAIANGTNAQNVIGVAANIDSQFGRVIVSGLAEVFSGLSANTKYYLSDSVAGGVSSTRPIANVIEVGTALSSSIMAMQIGEAQTGLPAGIMFDYAGGVVPSGFALCDGTAINRTTYAELFANIGTTWGPGDGSTTFNLPDFRRRAAVGSGGTGTAVLGNAVGNTGGSEDPTLKAHAHGASLGGPFVTTHDADNIFNNSGATGGSTDPSTTTEGDPSWQGKNYAPSAIVTKMIKLYNI